MCLPVVYGRIAVYSEVSGLPPLLDALELESESIKLLSPGEGNRYRVVFSALAFNLFKVERQRRGRELFETFSSR